MYSIIYIIIYIYIYIYIYILICNTISNLTWATITMSIKSIGQDEYAVMAKENEHCTPYTEYRGNMQWIGR